MVYKTEVPQEDAWKFVRVGDEYRWLRLDPWTSHKDCVKEGEKADAAGMINVMADCWTILDPWSMTLKVGMGDREIRDITRMLGKRFRDRWE